MNCQSNFKFGGLIKEENTYCGLKTKSASNQGKYSGQVLNLMSA